MPSSGLVSYAGSPFGIASVIQTTEAFENTSTTTINKGDAVIIEIPADAGENVGAGVVTTTTADSNRVIGIAIEEILAGQVGQVCVWGVVRGANVANASAAGDYLSTSTTAGRLATGVATGQGVRIALCLSTPSSNTADVFVSKA